MEVVAGYVRAATAALLQGAQTSSDLDLAMRALQVQGELEERGIGGVLAGATPATDEDGVGSGQLKGLGSSAGKVRGTARVVAASVPLAEMFGYATELRSRTQGRGSFTMHFGQYEEVPKSIAEEIITRVQGKVTK